LLFGNAAMVFGTTLRAIGRGFGSGTFAAACASEASTDQPNVNTSAAPNARNGDAGPGPIGVTAVLRGESFNRSGLSFISLNKRTKHKFC
jgi:hypothetical protein